MTDDDKSLGDDATLGGENAEKEIDARSLGDQSTHGDHSQMDSVGDSSSLGDQLTFAGDASGDALNDDMEIVDLESRYSIERVLGKGGMGEVLLATDTRLERKVAIKRILGKAARSKTAVNRFLTEAKSVAALNHPNIVQIHDYGRDKQGPFLIMEYVAGDSLLERCQQGAIALEESIELTVQLCDGLAAAHDAHIIHRDIKPANILLTKNNIPKLTDFGLAKAETVDTGMTQSGAVLGTLDFMPPEQRKDAALVDARSDLWSLAATLYQMLTGETPRVIDLDAVPRELRICLAQALKTNKDDRYQSAVEMGTALRECLTASAHTPITELGAGECPSCHTRNEANRKFCSECAGPLRAPCFGCESEIPVWDKVCGECGSNQHEKVKQLQEQRAEQRVEAEQLFKNGNYEDAAEIAEGLVKTANVLDPRVPDQPEWVEEFLAKTNDQKIRQLQEEQTKQRGKAEQLLKDNDYDGASEIAERLMSSANTSLPDSTDWAGNFLVKISSQKEAEINTMRALMDEAVAHRDAHDYRSGLIVLQKIPISMQNQTIPAHDKTPAELKEVFKHRLKQIQTLNQEIKQRVKNRELDGLVELVVELEGLRPGRPDLAQLRKQLDERDARYAERLGKALVDANAFCQRCEFSRAIEKILKIPKVFRNEEAKEMLNHYQRLATYKTDALQAMKQATTIPMEIPEGAMSFVPVTRKSAAAKTLDFNHALQIAKTYQKALSDFDLQDDHFESTLAFFKKNSRLKPNDIGSPSFKQPQHATLDELEEELGGLKQALAIAEADEPAQHPTPARSSTGASPILALAMSVMLLNLLVVATCISINGETVFFLLWPGFLCIISLGHWIDSFESKTPKAQVTTYADTCFGLGCLSIMAGVFFIDYSYFMPSTFLTIIFYKLSHKFDTGGQFRAMVGLVSSLLLLIWIGVSQLSLYNLETYLLLGVVLLLLAFGFRSLWVGARSG